MQKAAEKQLSTRTVGLFGTCGGSSWRDSFMNLFDDLGIPYFNPQVDNWTPELAEVEAWHLANDRLILFPVTGETFGFGSLAETGFSVQSALAYNANRFVVLYIEPEVCTELKTKEPEQADASRRARKLALAHLAQVKNPNVFVATSLENMRQKAVRLYAALEILDQARGGGQDWRSSMSPNAWHAILTQVHSGVPAEETAVATV
jgi:hypothetical protein